MNGFLSYSGYELEMLEAEAKDSEEEAEDTTLKSFGDRNMTKSPHDSKIGVPTTCELSKSVGKLSPATKGPLIVGSTMDMVLNPGEEKSSVLASSSHNIDVSNALSCQNTTSGELADPLDKIPDSMTVANDLTSTSRNAERPIVSDAMLSPLSYSAKTSRRSSLSMYSGEISGNLSDCSKAHLVKVSDEFDNFPFRVEQARDRFGPGCLLTSWGGTELVDGEESSGLLPQKTENTSYACFKSPKLNLNARPSVRKSAVVGDKTQGVGPTTSIDGSNGTNSDFLPGSDGLLVDEIANQNAVHNSHAKLSTPKPSTGSKNSVTCDEPSSETMTAETGQDNTAGEKTLSKSTLLTEPDIVDLHKGRFAHEVGEKGEPENQQQNVGSSTSNKNLETRKSDGSGNLSFPGGANDSVVTKPLRKKTVAKKTLGSRLKSTTANIQKGAIYLGKTISQNDYVIHSVEVKETVDCEKSSSSMKLEISSPMVNIEELKKLQPISVVKSGSNMENGDESMGDETEPPENKLEDELDKSVNKQKSGEVIATDEAGKMMEVNEEMAQHMTANYIMSMHDDAMAPKEGTIGIAPKQTICEMNFGLVETSLDGDGVTGKMNKRKNHPTGRAKVKKDTIKSKKGLNGEESRTQNKGTRTEKEKKTLLSSGKTKSCTYLSENLSEVEKENEPVKNLNQCKSVKTNLMPRKINQKAGEIKPKSGTSTGEVPNSEKTEPAWFILSAHRFQRKEFQQVIRRLKGRLCRDSHQWSYQATHLITTDPIRRTEKFFAAAASGRYVTSTINSSFPRLWYI